MAQSTSIIPSAGWPGVLARLERGTIMVLGGPGCGKTSFARYLMAQLDRGLGRVALVDCDVGRTAVGVPGCLGLALTAPWRAPETLWFVGDTEPEAQPLPAVVGTARLVERARAAGAEAVVLDTTAIRADAARRSLTYHTAIAARVGQVVAIQRGKELEPLLALLAREGLTIFRLAPSPAAGAASDDERRAQRERRLKAHLHGAATRLFGGGQIVGRDWGLGLAADNGSGPRGLEAGTVVGLLDDAGFCLGLGRVEEVHADRLAVSTPVRGRGVARLRVGSFRMAEDGSLL